jgi:hypothetical protein
MELHGFGYNGKSCFRQQFHPGWLSALPAAIPMGVAKHAVLAQAYQVKQPQPQFTHALKLLPTLIFWK